MALTNVVRIESDFIANDPRHVYERWQATGSTGAVGDTAVCNVHFPQKVGFVEGPFAFVSQSGQAVTVSALVALATGVTATFRIYSREGGGM